MKIRWRRIWKNPSLLYNRKSWPSAPYTANGDTRSLSRVLDEGLDSGLTVNEAGEILLQIYAYAGFPRSLNGLNALSEVLEKRKAEGKNDPQGPEAERLPADSDKYSLGAENLARLMGFPYESEQARRQRLQRGDGSVPERASFRRYLRQKQCVLSDERTGHGRSSLQP